MQIRLTFLFVILCYSASAQNLQFDRLESVKGLSNRSVTSIVQDNLGFVWFGTQDGLIRYDGYEIKLYKTNLKDNNSLTDNNVRALAKDDQGNLWIATQGGGVDRFNIQTEIFTHFKNDPNDRHSLSGNAVWSIFIDSGGMVWAGTFSNGLNRIDPSSGKIDRITEDTYHPVLAITEDPTGNIWFSSNGINRVQTKTLALTKFPAPSTYASLASGGVRALLAKTEHVLWAGAIDGGLFQIDVQSGEFKKIALNNDGARYNSVHSLLPDKQGAVWIGTSDGIVRLKGEERTFCHHSPTDKYSISTNAVRTIYSDNNGVLWVGTEGGGVNRLLSRKSFQLFQASAKPGALSFNVIRSIYEDSKGTIWVGTQGGGLNAFNPASKQFTPVKVDAKEISSVYEDVNGSYWIGSWGSGLFQCDFTSGRIRNYRHSEKQNSLLDDRIQVVHRDKFGVLWVGTESGLSSFDVDQNKWTAFQRPNFPNNLTGNNIQGQAFIEAEDGTLWIGTWFGLNKVSPDRKSVAFYTATAKENFLSSDHVISLYHDRKNQVMWIGTFGGGLNRLDLSNNNVTHFTEEHGLPNNTIFGIKQDTEGNLWLSTNNGLSRFNPATKIFRNYDATEGLQGNEFYWGAACSTKKGEMWFGGVNGLTVFHPAEIRDNVTVPPIVITGFELFNKPVLVQQGSALDKNVNFTSGLVLNYNQNVLTFSYSALNYNSPEKNMYAYYLENFDDGWSYVGSKRSVSYTNLNPGEYTLHVKGSNNDGLWNEKGIALRIVVVPPFWRTWWFYTIVGVLVVASIYMIIKLRLRSIRRDKELITQTLQQALDKAHDQLELEKQAVLEEQNKNKERNWIDQSLSIISEILSRSKNNVEELCNKVLSTLIKRCEVVAGAIYLYDENTEKLVKYANYGFSNVRQSIEVGSGQIGECFLKRQSIVINNLPEGYFTVTSGLGSATPKSLFLVPLQYEEICIGVIELASFSEIPTYRRQFIETLSAQLTATIHTTLISQKTSKLLEESRIQTEELKIREEELKQNLEELQAIQENFTRKTKAYEETIAQLQR